MNCCSRENALTIEDFSSNQKYFQDTNTQFIFGTITPSKTTTHELYELKDTFICRFCGGLKCKNEDYQKHPSPSIIGLHSDQIDENIFASQRPSNILIEKFEIIKQFHQKNIGLIVNVQRPGEHPYCGPNGGLDKPSGYTYSPSLFITEGIDVRLSGWEDLSVPDSLHFMLEIVKEMYTVIHKKKQRVLVHCHAGYGRTGIVIVCYKMFTENTNADMAIKELRNKRKGCIQKTAQYEYCKNFYEYIKRLREIFKEEKSDISSYLNNQNDLNVEDYKLYDYNRNVPLIIQYALTNVKEIKEKLNLPNLILLNAFERKIAVSKDIEDYYPIIIDNIHNGNWEILKRFGDVIAIIELMYKWMSECVIHCINPINIVSLFNNKNFIEKKNLDIIEKYLMKTEISTIKYIDDFIDDFNRNLEKEEEEHIIFVKRKLSQFLLGYGEKILNDKEKKNVTFLVELIDFFSNCINMKIKVGDKKSEQVVFEKDKLNKILNDIYLKLKQNFENGKNEGNLNYSINKKSIMSLGINNIINLVSELEKKAKENNNKKKDEEKNNLMLESIQFKNSFLGGLADLQNFPNSKTLKVNDIKENLRETVIFDNFTLKGKKLDVLSKPWLKEEDC